MLLFYGKTDNETFKRILIAMESVICMNINLLVVCVIQISACDLMVAFQARTRQNDQQDRTTSLTCFATTALLADYVLVLSLEISFTIELLR